MMHQMRNRTAFVVLAICEHVNYRRNQHHHPDLQYGGYEEDHGPQTGAGQSRDKKPQACADSLDKRNAQNSVGDAPNRRRNKLMVFRAFFVEDADEHRTRCFRGCRSIRQQCAGDQNREQECHDSEAESRGSRQHFR
jgi:hypothetical protein